MKIMVVDDSASIRHYLVECIQQSAAHAIAAETGKEALALYHDQSPDVILLDIDLPDINGFDIARRIRAEESKRAFADWTPIIFLTGHADDTSLAMGIEVGGDDYLKKPVSQVVLTAKIHAMRRIRDMRQKLFDVTRQLEEANQKLLVLSATDGLTGLTNRRQLDERIELEWRRAFRDGTQISLIMLDVDHFKRYNDTYGHPMGDECLRQIARVLRENARRPADLAARYGGEEFCVVLPGTDSLGAGFVATKIRQGVSMLGIEHKASTAASHVTVSIGVATARPNQFKGEIQAFIALADQALYQAKHQGRNRVVRLETDDLSQPDLSR